MDIELTKTGAVHIIVRTAGREEEDVFSSMEQLAAWVQSGGATQSLRSLTYYCRNESGKVWDHQLHNGGFMADNGVQVSISTYGQHAVEDLEAALDWHQHNPEGPSMAGS